jgi:hypothetical protein
MAEMRRFHADRGAVCPVPHIGCPFPDGFPVDLLSLCAHIGSIEASCSVNAPDGPAPLRQFSKAFPFHAGQQRAPFSGVHNPLRRALPVNGSARPPLIK